MIRRTGIASTILLTLLCCAPAWAQTPMEMPGPTPSPLLDSMAGDWTGTGQQMGMACTEQAHFEYQMNGMWLVGQHTMTMTMPDGTSMTGTTVSYHRMMPDGTYQGVFVDSMGMMMVYDGTPTETGFVMNSEMEGMAMQTSVTQSDPNTFVVTSQMPDPSGAMQDMGVMTYTRVQ